MKIYSLFPSINGEVCAVGQGHTTTFVRFAGCPLSCTYCDTKYASSVNSGTSMSVQDILNKVRLIGLSKVTVTGGEPLMQRVDCMHLLEELVLLGYEVSVETSGAYHPLDLIDVNWVMDWKLKNSGMDKHMRDEHFLALGFKDFVKFVVGDKKDYDEAYFVMKRLLSKGCRARFAFSPVMPSGDYMHVGLSIADLVNWMIADKIDGFVNLQLHKLTNLKEER